MSERRRVALRGSTVVENRLQADGSRAIRERHVHVDGREMFVEYREKNPDLQARLNEHAVNVLDTFTKEVVTREKEAAQKKFTNIVDELLDAELLIKNMTQREIDLVRNRVV